jgi:hypothetical protein
MDVEPSAAVTVGEVVGIEVLERGHGWSIGERGKRE